ncbi:hypothetical protein OG462_43875 [Streptomyces sp. NBC_01077]|uniref:hypothetical protein n=1 Tax=Streptomyces sp. NBC_01077 TaxID=2903746 RepID=UPI00387060E1|nr:hypothetical protein OG462_01130 [Streptomyces sp. NBC_01077]WSV44401.1 hypothetical protein OG462_43875 [Streptomyces sp. NBC_01077]
MKKRRIIPALLTSAIAAGAFIGATAGNAQAASGTSCSSWTINQNVWMRGCIQWSGTTADRAYTEVENRSGSSKEVAITATLRDDDGNQLAYKREVKALAINASTKVYTVWVDDFTWGPEKASGSTSVRYSWMESFPTPFATGWAFEPWY